MHLWLAGRGTRNPIPWTCKLSRRQWPLSVVQDQGLWLGALVASTILCIRCDSSEIAGAYYIRRKFHDSEATGCTFFKAFAPFVWIYSKP